jgi:hypothetical protein
MNDLNLDDVRSYVNDNIGEFHTQRINILAKLKLLEILKRKNPYLYKAKNIITSEQIIRGILDAYISSSEEGIFGDWLEGLAIFINKEVYGGWKSGISGIDLEFENENKRYIVNIKSGPNWGNRSQIQKMQDDFISAKKTLHTSGSQLEIVAINGCCYGKDNRPNKGDYCKYCGQRFWTFISGNESLYIEIVEPLGYNAKNKNDEYMEIYGKMINRFTCEFSNNFCYIDGGIDWGKLVAFNSAIK